MSEYVGPSPISVDFTLPAEKILEHLNVAQAIRIQTETLLDRFSATVPILVNNQIHILFRTADESSRQLITLPLQNANEWFRSSSSMGNSLKAVHAQENRNRPIICYLDYALDALSEDNEQVRWYVTSVKNRLETEGVFVVQLHDTPQQENILTAITSVFGQPFLTRKYQALQERNPGTIFVFRKPAASESKRIPEDSTRRPVIGTV